jgi:hypothetical protein
MAIDTEMAEAATAAADQPLHPQMKKIDSNISNRVYVPSSSSSGAGSGSGGVWVDLKDLSKKDEIDALKNQLVVLTAATNKQKNKIGKLQEKISLRTAGYIRLTTESANGISVGSARTTDAQRNLDCFEELEAEEMQIAPKRLEQANELTRVAIQGETDAQRRYAQATSIVS